MGRTSFSLTKALLLGTVALSSVRATMLREMDDNMMSNDDMELAQQRGWGDCFCQQDDDERADDLADGLEDVDDGSLAARTSISVSTSAENTDALADGSTSKACGCEDDRYGEYKKDDHYDNHYEEPYGGSDYGHDDYKKPYGGDQYKDPHYD